MSRKGDQISTLYIVSTPIGNLKDISYRAVDVLNAVDLIAAEDTRKTKILLNHYNISTPMISYYEHNEFKRIPQLMDKLDSGMDIAVVCDSGTPSINDPGYRLVREAIEKGFEITSIPGATSVTTALILSGLPTDRFVFEGFLPPKKGRKKRLNQLSEESRTIILFESPRRLVKTLEDCLNILRNRPVAVCKELTKIHENVFRGFLKNAVEYFATQNIKGEFVIIIGRDDSKIYFDVAETI